MNRQIRSETLLWAPINQKSYSTIHWKLQLYHESENSGRQTLSLLNYHLSLSDLFTVHYLQVISGYRLLLVTQSLMFPKDLSQTQVSPSYSNDSKPLQTRDIINTDLASLTCDRVLHMIQHQYIKLE